jgi:hypothetical protein
MDSREKPEGNSPAGYIAIHFLGSLAKNRGHLVNNPGQVIGYEDRAAQLKLWKKQYGM